MVREAARWAALLDSGDLGPRQRAACDAWCARHPLHRLALDRILGLNAGFTQLSDVNRRVLRLSLDRQRKRPALPHAVTAVVLLILCGVFVLRLVPPGTFPEVQTVPGEIRSLALVDGSDLTVDTGSSLDLRLDGNGRDVHLHRGRVMVEVAHDPTRPFTVRTAHGTATALGTAFTVQRHEEGTVVTVLSSRVRVCATDAPEGPECRELTAGGRARLTGTALKVLPPVDVHRASAWAKGWLEADDMPLPEILAELNRYRSRPIRFEATALDGYRVTGTLPVTDGPRTLAALEGVLGIRVVALTAADLLVLPAKAD